MSYQLRVNESMEERVRLNFKVRTNIRVKTVRGKTSVRLKV